MAGARLRGLYAITDGSVHGQQDALVDRVAQALAGGARVIQYRDKSSDQGRRRAQAQALAALCRQHRVPLLINDDVELASACAADGVHLGQGDAAVGQARARLGARAVIGVSCHDSLELALQAHQAGADYVAFGSFFASQSKPEAIQASLDVLRAARAVLDTSIVAIGGITPDNGAMLLQAGADALAVIHGVFGQPDIRAAAAQYAALFRTGASDPPAAHAAACDGRLGDHTD